MPSSLPGASQGCAFMSLERSLHITELGGGLEEEKNNATSQTLADILKFLFAFYDHPKILSMLYFWSTSSLNSLIVLGSRLAELLPLSSQKSFLKTHA